eukprot:gene9929-11757_t
MRSFVVALPDPTPIEQELSADECPADDITPALDEGDGECGEEHVQLPLIAGIMFAGEDEEYHPATKRGLMLDCNRKLTK